MVAWCAAIACARPTSLGMCPTTSRWAIAAALTIAFDEDGLMLYRIASINDAPIKEANRKFFWLLGGRPDHHPSL